MRVAIIASPYPLQEAPAPPLGISYVAAAFEAAGADVKILDYIVSRYSVEKLTAELEAFQPDLVGAGSVTMNFPGAAEIIKVVKGIDPSIVTVMGGPHITFDIENTLRRYPEIDLLVLGEGEKTIPELLPLIRNKKAWKNINGIAFVEDEKVVLTEPREFITDLDSLPLPARHLLPISRYQALGFPVSLITSRGCPNACIFCQGRRMVGKKIRYRDPVKIVDEIEEILSYGFTRINIADDLFLSNKVRAQKICKEILDRGVSFSWSAFSRVNTVDKDALRMMHEAGCDAVSFGVESGNPEMLKRIRKGITLDQARNAVNLCAEAGMTPHASFMVGLPGETPATLEETQRFAEELSIIYGYHFLAPFPGTTVREEIEEYDLELLTEDWTKYDANQAIVRTSSLSPEEIEKFVADFEAEHHAEWERMEKKYREGKATSEEWLRVSGKYRMELTYQLLSEDIIEDHGRFSIEDHGSSSDPGKRDLFEKVTGITGFNSDLVAGTLEDFISKGYISSTRAGRELQWHWTHKPML